MGVTPELGIDLFLRTSRTVSAVLTWAALFGFLALTGLGARFWKCKRGTGRAAGWFGVGVGIAVAALVGAVAWPILTGANLFMDVALGHMTTFIILIILSNIVALMVLGLTVFTIGELHAKLVGNSGQGVLSLVHWALVSLGGIGLLLVLAWFSLLGVNLP